MTTHHHRSRPHDVAHALAARERSRRAVEILVPIMRKHGFATAGEAIAWLEAHPEETP